MNILSHFLAVNSLICDFFFMYLDQTFPTQSCVLFRSNATDNGYHCCCVYQILRVSWAVSNLFLTRVDIRKSTYVFWLHGRLWSNPLLCKMRMEMQFLFMICLSLPVSKLDHQSGLRQKLFFPKKGLPNVRMWWLAYLICIPVVPCSNVDAERGCERRRGRGLYLHGFFRQMLECYIKIGHIRV